MELTPWILPFAHLYNDPVSLELLHFHKLRALCSEKLSICSSIYSSQVRRLRFQPESSLKPQVPFTRLCKIACIHRRHKEHAKHMKDPGTEITRGQFWWRIRKNNNYSRYLISKTSKLVVKCTDCGVRLPGFQSHLCHLSAVWPMLSYCVSISSSIK